MFHKNNKAIYKLAKPFTHQSKAILWSSKHESCQICRFHLVKQYPKINNINVYNSVFRKMSELTLGTCWRIIKSFDILVEEKTIHF